MAAGDIADLRTPVADPSAARWAMFYSITNCQTGLRGVSFGNFLIKQVVEDLSREFPRIRKFATLSPIPGFRSWLSSAPRLLSAELAAVSIDNRDQLMTLPSSLSEELRRLCAHYLVREKRGRAPLNSVARFHLANGARLARLNWMGDASAAGIAASFGMTAIAAQCIRLLRMDLGKDLVAASATPLVLAILAEGESYGYAIIKRVSELSGGHLQWTDGMLYPVLHRLERHALVASRWGSSESGRRRKYYRLTRQGRTQLEAERKRWQIVDETLHRIWMKACRA